MGLLPSAHKRGDKLDKFSAVLGLGCICTLSNSISISPTAIAESIRPHQRVSRGSKQKCLYPLLRMAAKVFVMIPCPKGIKLIV